MQYYRTIERTFPTGSSPRLRIANRRGELSIIGEDRDDIAFTAQIAVSAENEREADERLQAVELPMVHEGDVVVIGQFQDEERAEDGIRFVRQGWRFNLRLGFQFAEARIDMAVRVPRHCRVEATQRSGPARIAGLHAPVTVESRSGRTEVREVRGPVCIEARSGAVEVRDIAGDLDITGRSGRIEVEQVAGDAALRSRSGHVSVADVRGRLSVESRSGRMTLRSIDGEARAVSTSGAVEWRGAVRAPLSIEAQTGLIRLAVERGAGFYVDAETKHGSVRSELPVDHLDQPGQDAPVVRLRAQSGSIRIVAA